MRILAAIDPTTASCSNVLAASADIAEATGASVSLLHVIEGAGEMREPDAELVSRSEARLRELVRGWTPSIVGEVQATTGVASRDICATAGKGDVDLVVIGARRHDAFERVLGTTAAHVVNHCSASVLVVRGWRRPTTRLLAALDDSDLADVVREYAVKLALHLHGKVRLFRAFDMPGVVPADMLAQYPNIDAAVAHAAQQALGRHARLVPPEASEGISARNGPITWSEISEAAREYDADLIVLGSRAHSFAERLLGTTAAEVVDHAGRSVLVVKRPWRSDV